LQIYIFLFYIMKYLILYCYNIYYLNKKRYYFLMRITITSILLWCIFRATIYIVHLLLFVDVRTYTPLYVYATYPKMLKYTLYLFYNITMTLLELHLVKTKALVVYLLYLHIIWIDAKQNVYTIYTAAPFARLIFVLKRGLARDHNEFLIFLRSFILCSDQTAKIIVKLHVLLSRETRVWQQKKK